MAKKIDIYYKVIDVLEEVYELEKVIIAYKNSQSDYSKIQYLDLKQKYLIQLKNLLQKNTIDIGKLLNLSKNKDADFYSPIVNNTQHLLANAKSNLDVLEDTIHIKNYPKSLSFVFVLSIFEAVAQAFIIRKHNTFQSLYHSESAPDVLSYLYQNKAINTTDKKFLSVKRQFSLSEAGVFDKSIEQKDIRRIKAITWKVVEKIETTVD